MAVARPPESYLVGLLGSGIGPSLSPALHEREADQLGLRYLYRRLDLDSAAAPLGEILAATRLAGFDGLNITHPCKQSVLKHLDELSPDAAALGAVNTVVFADGRAYGHNTDSSGFARGVGLGLRDVSLDRVVLLGAGGAGTAVAHALLTLGTELIRIFDTDEQRSAVLADSLRVRFGDARAVAEPLAADGADLARALRDVDGLAHATPVGMAARPGLPLPIDMLDPRLWVADVVYRPLNTPLITAARDRGCRVLDGGRMAVFQAADAFRLFTGRDPDPDRMLRHFNELAGTGEHDTHVHR